jgi:hypothetical protein
VNIERRTPSVPRFAHDVAEQIEGLGKGRGERELERLGSGLTLARLRQVGGKETIDDEGMKLSAWRMRQSVTAFDLVEEALRDQETLMFKGGRKHHIVPQLAAPTVLAPAGRGIGRAARTPEAAQPAALYQW